MSDNLREEFVEFKKKIISMTEALKSDVGVILERISKRLDNEEAEDEECDCSYCRNKDLVSPERELFDKIDDFIKKEIHFTRADKTDFKELERKAEDFLDGLLEDFQGDVDVTLLVAMISLYINSLELIKIKKLGVSDEK